MNIFVFIIEIMVVFPAIFFNTKYSHCIVFIFLEHRWNWCCHVNARTSKFLHSDVPVLCSCKMFALERRFTVWYIFKCFGHWCHSIIRDVFWTIVDPLSPMWHLVTLVRPHVTQLIFLYILMTHQCFTCHFWKKPPHFHSVTLG